MIDYSEDRKYAFFDGKKYTRDDKTGYYLNSTIRKRLHRAVWEYYNGSIPEGCHVHHKRDKDHNEIQDLELIAKLKHWKEHGVKKFKNDKKWFKKFREKGIEAAKQWHGSEDGKEWHKKHYEEYKHLLHQKEQFVCEQCGKKYTTENKGKNRFCSNKCKSAWRRSTGIDNETRKCVLCGNEFVVNKYSKVKCCSKSCSARYGHLVRRKAI
jgi:hypothetical protein